MKKIIGYLKNLTIKCFAKDQDGNLRELHPGEPVYEGEIIVNISGDKIPDALRTVKKVVVEKSVMEEDIDSQLLNENSKQGEKQVEDSDQDYPRSTTSTDTFEKYNTEINIEVPLNNESIFSSNIGIVRNEIDGEINIDAPLRETEEAVSSDQVERYNPNDTVNLFVADHTYTDTARNSGTGDTQIRAIDTAAPTIDITVDDVNLSEGESATVTFTFSEEISGFDVSDITAIHGTISNLIQDANDPKVWTATFTPEEDYEGGAKVSVADHTYTDTAGNSGAGNTQTFTIDTRPPSLTISVDTVAGDDIINAAEEQTDITITGTVGGDAAAGDTVTLTVDGTEYTGTVAADLTYSIDVPGTKLTADGDTTIDAKVTGSDDAGNSFEATTTHAYTVDTTASATISVDTVAGDDIINAAEEQTVFSFTGSVGGVAGGGVTVSLTVF
jgi:hypothetical protein